jgi:hypothetical protein
VSKSSRRGPDNGPSSSGQPPKGRHPNQRKAAAAAKPAPTYSSPLARKVAARSMPVLIRLHGLPRWSIVVGLGGFLIAGLLISGVIGGLLLVLLTLFVGWLLFLSWPVLEGTGRFTRLLVVGMLGAVAVLQFTA